MTFENFKELFEITETTPLKDIENLKKKYNNMNEYQKRTVDVLYKQRIELINDLFPKICNELENVPITFGNNKRQLFELLTKDNVVDNIDSKTFKEIFDLIDVIDEIEDAIKMIV